MATSISTLQAPKTVFISNRSGHDFSDSERYGSPIYVTSGLVNRFAVNYMARRWMKALLESNSSDYILITSFSILTCVGCAIFGWMHGRLNLLLYRNAKYISRSIDFTELKAAVEKGIEEDESL